MAIHTYYGFTATGGPARRRRGRRPRGAPRSRRVFVLLTITLSVYGQSGNFHPCRGEAVAGTQPGAEDRPDLVGARAAVLVIAAITALTALLFSGSLRKTVPLTVISDRAGLVMEDGAKVKLRGVQIGEVTSIGSEHTPAGCQSVHPETQDRPWTVSVSAEQRRGGDQVQHRSVPKYVDLVVPSADPVEGTSRPPVRCCDHATSPSRSTPSSRTCSRWCAPSTRRNSTPSSPRWPKPCAAGRVMGQAITAANDVLLAVNPRMDRATGLAVVRPDSRPIPLPHRTSCLPWPRSPPPARRSPSMHRPWTRCCCPRSGSPVGINTIGGNQPAWYGR